MKKTFVIDDRDVSTMTLEELEAERHVSEEILKWNQRVWKIERQIGFLKSGIQIGDIVEEHYVRKYKVKNMNSTDATCVPISDNIRLISNRGTEVYIPFSDLKKQ